MKKINIKKIEKNIKKYGLPSFAWLLNEDHAIAFKKLFLLIGEEQSKKWHDEGDAFTHTTLVVDYVRKNYRDKDILWAAIFHDTGKAETGNFNASGNITHHGHERNSVDIWDEFADTYTKFSAKRKEKISWLIENHMKASVIVSMKKAKQNRIVSHKYAKQLLALWTADKSGSIRNIELTKNIKDNKKEGIEFLKNKLMG